MSQGYWFFSSSKKFFHKVLTSHPWFQTSIIYQKINFTLIWCFRVIDYFPSHRKFIHKAHNSHLKSLIDLRSRYQWYGIYVIFLSVPHITWHFVLITLFLIHEKTFNHQASTSFGAMNDNLCDRYWGEGRCLGEGLGVGGEESCITSSIPHTCTDIIMK